jgi:hypothetical protein
VEGLFISREVRRRSREATQLVIMLKLVSCEVSDALISNYNRRREMQHYVQCSQLPETRIQKRDNNSRVSEVLITVTFRSDHECRHVGTRHVSDYNVYAV